MLSTDGSEVLQLTYMNDQFAFEGKTALNKAQLALGQVQWRFGPDLSFSIKTESAKIILLTRTYLRLQVAQRAAGRKLACKACASEHMPRMSTLGQNGQVCPCETM